MRTAITSLALTVAISATLAAGLFQGRLTNRWGIPLDLAAAGQRVAALPEQIGDWQLRSSEPFDDEVVEMLQCVGHLSRVYMNSATGEVVRMALVAGPPGPTAVHTPEICYSSRDHVIKDSRALVRVRADEYPVESFWGMTFQANDVEHSLLRVMYAWAGPDGRWEASRNPRFEYGGTELLYKLQLAARLPADEDLTAGDPCQRFLKELLPALNGVLFQEVMQ